MITNGTKKRTGAKGQTLDLSKYIHIYILFGDKIYIKLTISTIFKSTVQWQ